MEPAAADLPLLKVGGEILGQLLGERCHQHPLARGHHLGDLTREVHHLVLRGHDLDHGVEQAGRPDHLLHHLAAGAGEFPRSGRGRHEYRLMEPLLPLVKHQRPVVEGAGQPEAVIDERRLAALVAGVHAADLRHGDVRLIDEEQEVVGKVVEERAGCAAGRPARERPGIVLDPRAEARLHQHLDVESRAGVEPLGFQQLALALELLQPGLELVLDRGDCRLDAVFGHHEVAGRIEIHLVFLGRHLAAGGMRDRDRLQRVAPELDTTGEFVVRGPDVDGIAADAKLSPLQRQVAPLVVHGDELLEQLVAGELRAGGEPHHHRPVVVGRTEAVDARYARHHHHVAAADEGAGGREPQSVDLLVDRGILLNVDVALRNVGLGLVVVVVADEVVDGVVREEVAKLGIQLGGERLVVRQHERGPAHARDHVGHREGLAGAGHPHQHLRGPSVGDPADERIDRGRLVARGLVGGDEFEDAGVECGRGPFHGAASRGRMGRR